MTERERNPLHARTRAGWVDVSFAASLVLLTAGGCSTKAYCFANCGEGGAYGDEGSAGTGDGTGDKPSLFGGAGDGPSLLRDGGTDTDAGDCEDESEEVCDGRDNNCNGKVDEGIDFSDPQNCGTCALNCSHVLLNVAVPICVPPDKLNGKTAGDCTFEECAQDYYDIDPETPGCEYFCDRNPDGKNRTDVGGTGCGRDDDCDGQIDEDLDLCSDTDNCGACGKACSLAHSTAECVTDASDGDECTEENTHCAIQSCKDGHSDADGKPDNGCEHICPSKEPEKCDGIDNDCDGLIDNTDPDLESAEGLGDACRGGAQGACAAAEHEGIRKCIGGQLRCCDPDSNEAAGSNPNAPREGLRNGVCDAETGTHVLRPGNLSETCNAVDDDCDGVIDDSPSQVGETCGNAQGVCVVGSLSCNTDKDSADYGKLVCRGATLPREEICNSADDDCDGVVDGTLITPVVECDDNNDCTDVGGSCLAREEGGSVCATPSSDSGSACQVPVAPPEGSTSACHAGVTECRGGTLVCEGAETRNPTTPDTCGVDQNCDGNVDNTNLSLLTTCGSCTNDCTAQGVNAAWTCEDDSNGSYECVQHGCKDGWYECKADDGMECETYCRATGGEVCNGVDDDCNCEIDEGVTTDPRAVCGVRSTANTGCDPDVDCVDGAWQCTFSDPDVCGGAAADCAGTPDATCDEKDNDCDGVVDNAYAGQKDATCVKTLGQCEETGVKACDLATGELVCNAADPVRGSETCNGKDDDCDGFVDEIYSDTGAGADDEDYVRPDLVALTESGPWIFAYEASRPDATAAAQGSGNGYFDAAPTGAGRDRTIACSTPDRVPWTNVSPWEMEQTCEAIGGRVCLMNDWQKACRGSGNTCTLGFLGCETASNYDTGPYCNLGAFELEGGAAEGTLLPTASSELSSCASSWTSVFGNELNVLDITGNAREAVRCQKNRAVCTDCAQNCCSGTSTTVDGPGVGTIDRTVCGSGLGDATIAKRVLSGQPCSVDSQCCTDDVVCSIEADKTGRCLSGVCASAGATSSCVGRGVACPDADEDGDCDYGTGDGVPCCSDAPRSGGICGGGTSLPHPSYPLLGGSYRTDSEASATCSYSFFKVDYDFKLFDSGFRCCFDIDPR